MRSQGHTSASPGPGPGIATIFGLWDLHSVPYPRCMHCFAGIMTYFLPIRLMKNLRAAPEAKLPTPSTQIRKLAAYHSHLRSPSLLAVLAVQAVQLAPAVPAVQAVAAAAAAASVGVAGQRA